MNKLQKTTNSPIPIIPRLIAGGILTFFSIKHFSDPQHFCNILKAAGFPLVEISVWAASAMELVAGLLLLSGFLTRIGGVLGVAAMVPAIIATLKISGLEVESLPAGLTEIPFVPPLPLPIITLVTSAIATIIGGGKLSVDKKMTSNSSVQETAK